MQRKGTEILELGRCPGPGRSSACTDRPGPCAPLFLGPDHLDHHNSEAAADDDVVWGAEAVGRVINRNPRQTYHLLQTGALPAERSASSGWRRGSSCAQRSSATPT